MKTAIVLVLMCLAALIVIGCNAKGQPEHTGMPDPAYISRQKSTEKVNMVYGTDKVIVTLYKPSKAYFSIMPERAQNAGDRVYLEADDGTFSAEIFSTVYFDGNDSNEAFAEYYFCGELVKFKDEYEYFHQETQELGVSYKNMQAKRITSTYKRKGEKEEFSSCFVGFEFENTNGSEPEGKGLMGFKIYGRGREISDRFVKGLFNEMFRFER